MPGIVEETHLSLEAHQPVFVLGGSGGCARDIGETLGFDEPWAGPRDDWPGRRRFRKYLPDDFLNGLTLEEILVLARTPHIRLALYLVPRGLRRVLSDHPLPGSLGFPGKG